MHIAEELSMSCYNCRISYVYPSEGESMRDGMGYNNKHIQTVEPMKYQMIRQISITLVLRTVRRKAYPE